MLRLKAKIIVILTSAVIRKPTAHLNTVFILLFPPLILAVNHKINK